MPISTDTNLSDGCIQTAVYIIGIVAIIIASYYWSSYGCAQQTRDMGFNHRYAWVTGCQIEVEEGKWIPLDSYYFKEE